MQKDEQILAVLRALISRPDCVLSFDADLVELLPDILAERHGINSDSALDAAPQLRELFDCMDIAKSERRISDLPRLIRESGVDLAEFDVRTFEGRVATVAKEFDHWSEDKVADSLDAVVTLQKDLGMGAHNAASGRYEANRSGGEQLRRYLRSVTTPPATLRERLLRKTFWEMKLAKWLKSGFLDPDTPSLSVGPRWVSEIEFFRQIVGLRKHIGLDLFSDDPDLVVAGDMHKMPFPDAHFQFAFLKNVVDKSYEIRRLVRELIRVVRPGGIVVIDQICGYGSTTPLTRTDIQRAGNLARIFERHAPVDRLVCEDVDISGIGDSAGTNEKRYNARLALRVGSPASGRR